MSRVGRTTGIFFAKLWRDANRLRKLPSNLEMFLYINDKPQVHHDHNRLPVFCIAGHFPAGSGPLPHQWLGYVPFSSHFYDHSKPVLQQQPTNSRAVTMLRTNFYRERPVVSYWGTFSENEWSRYNRSDTNEYLSTPRFKLANATKHWMCWTFNLRTLRQYGTRPRRTISDMIYNITMGQYIPALLVDNDINAMMSLSVNGNGCAGATTMRGLLCDTAMLKIVDQTIDNEGYNRDMGEIYFPFLTPNVHYISVEAYEMIATTARALLVQNNRSDGSSSIEKLFQINQVATEFALRNLGYDCALDLVELLAWRYYEYVESGCATEFAHVQIQK